MNDEHDKHIPCGTCSPRCEKMLSAAKLLTCNVSKIANMMMTSPETIEQMSRIISDIKKTNGSNLKDDKTLSAVGQLAAFGWDLVMLGICHALIYRRENATNS